ncbi:siderophore-interacting protein [Cellulomonas soli]|uniref:Siderophore-interacting protein n=1 Tax=Cellulomonas soli TaxID=931535 RepID=A0A512PFZ3_9CELL|nr:siderophore-interacting protein [Cellulomonas soli]NYI59745.1 NADPH-dependent ferric siderophore reductase [Cellulomonas soli]GEP70113.1 siderophore-interacting protein [Cellulomonas soli]
MTDSPTRAPGRPRPAPLRAEVVRAERISPAFVRVVLGGPGLAGFVASPHADSYVKLVFLPEAAAHAPALRPDGRLDLDAVRAGLPPHDQPRQRSYTVRAFDPAAGELALDMVVHGDEGVAGPWAARAAVGDTVWLVGPGGAWSPDPTVASHLLIGDASALPAVAVALERLPEDAVGTVVLEVPGPEDELPLTAPAGIDVRWVHEQDHTPGRALVAAVEALPPLPGPVGAFLHGEAGAVRTLRAHLRTVQGVQREHLSVSGYWRLGADDEGWRAGKRAWLATIEEQEQAAGLA